MGVETTGANVQQGRSSPISKLGMQLLPAPIAALGSTQETPLPLCVLFVLPELIHRRLLRNFALFVQLDASILTKRRTQNFTSRAMYVTPESITQIPESLRQSIYCAVHVQRAR